MDADRAGADAAVPCNVLPGPRWYRWWDFGNGTMSDLGGHDNDLAFQVFDIRYPLPIEAVSPIGKAHSELAPATLARSQ